MQYAKKKETKLLKKEQISVATIITRLTKIPRLLNEKEEQKRGTLMQ